jgi:mannose-6-phosphate isomerase-like protein (cupin superfamily)
MIAMERYVSNIEKKSLENEYFREVLFTGPHSQLVVMSIAPGEDIGMETHKEVDQFFKVEAGIGLAILDGKEYNLENGSAVVIPAGTEHNIINRSKSEPLKVYTIYSPPNHPHGTIHKDKAEALAYEKKHQ